MTQIGFPQTADPARGPAASAAGPLPQNFMVMEITDVVPLGPNFLRLTLRGHDVSRHGDEAIHFRLVQPPAGAEARWPGVAPNGSIKWPEGQGAPHRPVYTTRHVDLAAGTLTTDIYLHDGGRTTLLAQQIMAGDTSRRTVGVVGPSGGGLMAADQVLIASDETGFPAAARILAGLPRHATGQVLLEAQHGAACAYPIQAPHGITITWLTRANGDCLLDTALKSLPDHATSKIWFAGARGDATQFREAARAAGRAASDLRISGFWTR